ncbi:MAG TPA: PqqD family protein [Blastocatellia bacterium]|nr:PqqD family protein [Blastocatellia bacterium]
MKNEQPLPQARTTDLVTQELQDEVLVYDLKAHKAHCLNQTAATIWKYCDGKTTVSEMTDRMQNDFGQRLDEASVWHAINRLSKANLLEVRVKSPADIPRLGRREAIRHIGIGSAIAVPVVMSILAPSALAGCTFAPGSRNNGQTCCIDINCASTCCAAGICAAMTGATGDPCTVGINCTCASGNCMSNAMCS